MLHTEWVMVLIMIVMRLLITTDEQHIFIFQKVAVPRVFSHDISARTLVTCNILGSFELLLMWGDPVQLHPVCLQEWFGCKQIIRLFPVPPLIDLGIFS